MKVPFLLLLFACLVASCSSVHTERVPHTDLGGIKHFYVEHRLTDDHHLDDIIVAELRSRGLDASDGPLTMMPENAEAVVRYLDDWEWDFKSYVIQLRIDIRRARTDQPLATGTYRQPSPITKSLPEVVRAILKPLFDKS